MLSNQITFSATAPGSVGAQVCILFSKRVPPFTSFFSSIDSGRALASEIIFSVCDRLQVGRIHTRSFSTQMVDGVLRGDLSFVDFVRHTMRQIIFKITGDVSVPRGFMDFCCPFPTAVFLFFEFCKEIGQQRFYFAPHVFSSNIIESKTLYLTEVGYRKDS